MEFMEALVRYQSETETGFVKERTAVRFDRERLLRLFYPFRRVLNQLIDIRIASIRLFMWLGSTRTTSAARRLVNNSKRMSQLLASYRRYRDGENLRAIMTEWFRTSQVNFVRRKQYQLSSLFRKTHLQRKVFGSMIARAEDGRPLRHTAKALFRLLNKKRCAAAVRRIKLLTE